MEDKSWNNTVIRDRLLLDVSIKVEDSGLYLFLFSFLFSFSLLFYFLIWNLKLGVSVILMFTIVTHHDKDTIPVIE